MNNRVVSDAFGFVFVFAIVLSMVGFVAAVGTIGLQDVYDVGHVNNAERALDIPRDNMEDTADHDMLSRATEVKLQDASLMPGRPVESVVSDEWTGDPSVNFTNTYEVSLIVYESDPSDERVVYAFDALFRTHGDTGTFVRRPSLVLTDKRVLILVFVTRPDEEATTAIGELGTFLIHADKIMNDMLVAWTEDSHDVNPTVRSPRVALRERELSNRLDVACDNVVEPPDVYPSVSCYANGMARAYVISMSVGMTFAD